MPKILSVGLSTRIPFCDVFVLPIFRPNSHVFLHSYQVLYGCADTSLLWISASLNDFVVACAEIVFKFPWDRFHGVPALEVQRALPLASKWTLVSISGKVTLEGVEGCTSSSTTVFGVR